MEFERDTIISYDTVAEATLCQEETLESIVPDACPDILRIVDVCGQATISGKYGGGVFCNLPDGTVCMCNYAYQYQDADFKVGDTVILAIQRFDMDKKQMYGKILTKW